MTIRGPRLTRSQAVSQLALKSLRAADDVRVMGYVADLIGVEARPATIHELTGVARKVVQGMYEREVMRPMTGRSKEKIGDLMIRPRTHLEVSYFISKYSYGWIEDGRVVTAPGVIRAYKQYLLVATDETRFNPEAAVLLARMYHDDAVYLDRCEVCATPWLKTRQGIRIGWSHGHGNCPYCRSLISKDPRRAALGGKEIAGAKKTWERLLAHGKAI